MNKNEFVTAVAACARLKKVEAARAIEGVIEVVSKSLKKGEPVRLVGFGTFSTVHRRATEGRNPRTGAKIKIAATKVPKFRPGKTLRENIS